jgi:hypothetical protein
MEIANINSNAYVQTVSNSSVSITTVAADRDNTKRCAIIYNSGLSPVLALAATDGSAETAVYPTSPTSPVTGTVIAPGAVYSLRLPVNTTHISFIAPTAGSNVVHVTVTYGP